MPKEPQKSSEEAMDESTRGAGRELERHAYETGARKPLAGVSRRPDPVHTGDAGDEPRKPYGLTEPTDDRGEATRHYDGKDEEDARGKG
jgi:hypothetical protein